jgi:hypothetical protein
LKAESGCAGLNEPVQGAPAMAMVWIELAAESSRIVWQKLFPLFRGRYGTSFR